MSKLSWPSGCDLSYISRSFIVFIFGNALALRKLAVEGGSRGWALWIYSANYLLAPAHRNLKLSMLRSVQART